MGPMGPAGPSGPPGIAGLELLTVNTIGSSLTAQCPAGKAAASAGFSATETTTIAFVPLLVDGSQAGSGQIPTGWKLGTTGTGRLQLFLLCYLPGGTP